MNIAKILEKHPKGLKLYSPTFGDVIFERIKSDGWIVCTVADTGMTILFYTDGKYSKKGELVLFPSKTNRSWETFPRPFIDGDIVTCECGAAKQIFIFKEYATNGAAICYCFLDVDDTLNTDGNIYYVTQHATQQEKERFFTALNKHGYRWNPETKTLSKLPKFKKGDKVKHKKCGTYCTICEYTEGIRGYYTNIGLCISDNDIDNWELVPHKFDTNTLKPFDKVLVRNEDNRIWKGNFFNCYYSGFYVCVGGDYRQCIPYKGNEHLLGENDDCEDYYKNWR